VSSIFFQLSGDHVQSHHPVGEAIHEANLPRFQGRFNQHIVINVKISQPLNQCRKLRQATIEMVQCDGNGPAFSSMARHPDVVAGQISTSSKLEWSLLPFSRSSAIRERLHRRIFVVLRKVLHELASYEKMSSYLLVYFVSSPHQSISQQSSRTRFRKRPRFAA